MRSPCPSRSAAAAVVAFVLLVAAVLALSACGTTATRPTQLPTRTSPVPALSFPVQKPSSFRETGGTTDGWELVPWVDVEVSALGYYDDGGDGFLNTHTVGIFEKSTKRLVTAKVTVDSQSPLRGRYRYESIPTVLLKAGTSYVVAGTSFPPTDAVRRDPKGLAVAPEIRYMTGYGIRTGFFVFPKSGDGDYRDTSVNFEFMPASAASAASPTP